LRPPPGAPLPEFAPGCHGPAVPIFGSRFQTLSPALARRFPIPISKPFPPCPPPLFRFFSGSSLSARARRESGPGRVDGNNAFERCTADPVSRANKPARESHVGPPVDRAFSPGAEAELSRPQCDGLGARRCGFSTRTRIPMWHLRKLPDVVPVRQPVMAAKLTIWMP
jgi:hypothetical protein